MPDEKKDKLSTPEILRSAASYIEGGFVKGNRHDAQGQCCALGALENAVAGKRLKGDWRSWDNSNVMAESTCPEAIKVLAKMVPPSNWMGPDQEVYAIVNYNNAQERTSEQVAAKMRLAAHLLETGAFL